jgi:hypothetical protein
MNRLLSSALHIDRIVRAVAITAGIMFSMSNAGASIVTFSGSDDGAPVSGPFPNSTAASASFLAAAAALGPVNTVTFENQAPGYNANFSPAPGLSISLSASDFGDGYSGISDTTFGNVFGFNTTTGGSHWLGFPAGTATFSFASPTQSFGFWMTGVQDIFTSDILITFSDGLTQSLNAPVNASGGAAYFGFTDAAASIASITISNTSTDAWGIDDVTYNASTAAVVPEPASMALFGIGILGLAMRRRQAKRI